MIVVSVAAGFSDHIPVTVVQMRDGDRCADNSRSRFIRSGMGEVRKGEGIP